MRSTFLPRNLPQPATRLAIGAIVAMLTVAAARGAAADHERRSPTCGTRTLQGEYGFLVSGTRGLGPTTSEGFVGVGLRTYDGRGGLTDQATFHGQVTGIQGGDGQGVTGTYEVNPDCTGTSTVFVPDLPFPIVSAFVIVRGGLQVKEIVVSPLPNLVTAVFERQ